MTDERFEEIKAHMEHQKSLGIFNGKESGYLDELIREREQPKQQEPEKCEPYYDKRGRLNWGYPVDVRHLILQLQTLDPAMKVSSVMHIGGRARAYGLSMSRERWGESGWLDFTLDVPECLAIWACEKPKETPTEGSSMPEAKAAEEQAK